MLSLVKKKVSDKMKIDAGEYAGLEISDNVFTGNNFGQDMCVGALVSVQYHGQGDADANVFVSKDNAVEIVRHLKKIFSLEGE